MCLFACLGTYTRTLLHGGGCVSLWILGPGCRTSSPGMQDHTPDKLHRAHNYSVLAGPISTFRLLTRLRLGLHPWRPSNLDSKAFQSQTHRLKIQSLLWREFAPVIPSGSDAHTTDNNSAVCCHLHRSPNRKSAHTPGVKNHKFYTRRLYVSTMRQRIRVLLKDSRD